MRLQCPNCDAEYEVDDAAIPLAGRDVQCSSCGHAWFQAHPEALKDEAPAEEETVVFATSADSAAPVAEPEPEPEPAVPAEDLLDAPEAAPDLPAPELPRRSIDESVLAVLREEAEREAAARRGERPVIETQTELPLPEAPRPRPAPVPSPMPVLEDPVDPSPPPIAPPEPVTPHEPPSKRALLPEIEEIKSSLHPTVEVEEDEPTAVVAKGGFASGFVFVVLIALILVSIYVLADLIALQVPALKGAITVYVQAVDTARIWLDVKLRALIGWLQTKAQGTVG